MCLLVKFLKVPFGFVTWISCVNGWRLGLAFPPSATKHEVFPITSSPVQLSYRCIVPVPSTKGCTVVSGRDRRRSRPREGLVIYCVVSATDERSDDERARAVGYGYRAGVLFMASMPMRMNSACNSTDDYIDHKNRQAVTGSSYRQKNGEANTEIAR